MFSSEFAQTYLGSAWLTFELLTRQCMAYILSTKVMNATKQAIMAECALLLEQGVANERYIGVCVYLLWPADGQTFPVESISAGAEGINVTTPGPAAPTRNTYVLLGMTLLEAV